MTLPSHAPSEPERGLAHAVGRPRFRASDRPTSNVQWPTVSSVAEITYASGYSDT